MSGNTTNFYGAIIPVYCADTNLIYFEILKQSMS